MRQSLSRSLLSALSDFVAARTGLHFPEARWSDLERSVAAAASELGMPDVESYSHWLLSASPTRDHVEVLASHLTVGETYFFRERATLDALGQRIVPELMRTRPVEERHLRIWSAGCCTGEEPYSIAMLIDGLVPRGAGWTVTILATDINPRFLRKAAEGIYGEWSFRGTPERIRDRYFKRKRDGLFELHVRIRDMVTFSYLNLADDVYPALMNYTNAMDVIFCRNVLMYFTPDRARSVVRNLHRSLVDGGWLIVSPTETSNALFAAFTTVELPGALVYRRVDGDRSQAPQSSFHSPEFARGESILETVNVPPESAVPSIPGVDSESGRCDAPEPTTLALDVAPPPDQNVEELPSVVARRCANEGKLAEAFEWCEKAIAADKMNPSHHYLCATILQEQGQNGEAARSLMRALYLDPSFVLAYIGLGNIEVSLGRPRQARRHFLNALESLQSYARDELPPESEGLTAGRLTEILAALLASLPHLSEDARERTISA